MPQNDFKSQLCLMLGISLIFENFHECRLLEVCNMPRSWYFLVTDLCRSCCPHRHCLLVCHPPIFIKCSPGPKYGACLTTSCNVSNSCTSPNCMLLLLNYVFIHHLWNIKLLSLWIDWWLTCICTWQLMCCMHTLNAAFLLLDTSLNSLVSISICQPCSRTTGFTMSISLSVYWCPFHLLFFQPFPWFRLSYFVLWSCIYVIFQWVIHALGFPWYA